MPPTETTSATSIALRTPPGAPISAREVRARVRFALAYIDPVLVALGALLVGLWVFNRAQASETLLYVAGELARIAPWLAASVVIAAAARATGADALAARAFTGREGRMIVVASLIGALLPFCSCGVIPLVAGLLGAGVPLAPVMAFWIASPLMGTRHNFSLPRARLAWASPLPSCATGFPAMVAVWALVKPRAFALYIGFAVLGALIAGYTYAAMLAAP
jgi:uncharacterized membrane protein YraQ (UPF0718 family)